MKSMKTALFSKSYRILFLLIFSVAFVSSSFAQDYQEIKAEKGEGAYALLRRLGISPAKYINQFFELNKENLGPDNSLFAGTTYLLPVAVGSAEAGGSEITSNEPNSETTEIPVATSARVATYDIFGEKYKDVTIEDEQLSGAVYYLVAGHGGPDPGALGNYQNTSISEDEYAYDVTLRLARVLIQHGALVYMIIRDPNDGIRDDRILKMDQDEKCYPNLTIPRNQVARLRQRTDAVNNLYMNNRDKTQRVVIIHVDSRSEGENIDVFFYHDKRSETGEKLAKNLQQTFKEKYDFHQPSRGYKGTISTRGLYVLKNTYPPAVYIELGNINHSRDQLRFLIEDNRQALANWLADGLIMDYNNNK